MPKVSEGEEGMDIMDNNQQELHAKREARRKRRKRNQFVAYTTMVGMIIFLAVGIVFGVDYVKELAKQEEESTQQQAENLPNTETDTEEEMEQVQEPEKPEEPQEPEEIIVELTPQQKLDEIVDACIEVMPLEDKVAGLFVVTPESITGVNAAVKAGDGTREALAKYAVGGIIYSDKNIRSQEQLMEMIDNTRNFSRYRLFVAVEEEGGSISTVANAGIGTKTDAAQTIAQSADTNNAYLAGGTIGGYLSQLGFDLNFAPVADINTVEGSALKDRTYGSDGDATAPFVTAMMQGLQEQKVTACLKYFPGTGSTTKDTKDGMAVTERTLEEFRANEFKVFQAAIEAGADMIMVGHLSAPALIGDNTPCSLSVAVVTNLLREELAYDGVIVSDALNKKAISEYYDSEQAAVLALRAGCDMLLMPENFEEAYNGVLKAVQEGTISEERINDALKRIYRIKFADKIEE